MNFRWADLDDEKEGFYLSHQSRNGSYTAVLAIAVETRPTNQLLGSSSNKKGKNDKKKEQMFQIYRPNTGLQVRLESLTELEKKYRKVESGEADMHWIKQYDASVNICSHSFWNGTCRQSTLGFECEVCKLSFLLFFDTKLLFYLGWTASPYLLNFVRVCPLSLGSC